MMGHPFDSAILYCEGAFRTTNGKTAHGLVRRSRRYRVLSVIDSTCAGEDAGALLDGEAKEIPIVASLEAAKSHAATLKVAPTHLIVGLAPDGGRLPATAREVVRDALDSGLHVVSGLHDFLGDDPDLAERARAKGVTITDVRKPPPIESLHFFTGEIDRVGSSRIAVLGTDSAVGKRTTAWMLVDALEARGTSAELIGTGQTAWLQGARYSLILDSLVNDFVTGEIEHTICTAWRESRPSVMILEGQGSLLNPAYPGGFELLAAGRPHAIVLQHAPMRRFYDGFPDQPMDPLARQIEALEIVSKRPVVAITLSAEGMSPEEVERACEQIAFETGRCTVEPLRHGVALVLDALGPWLDGSYETASGTAAKPDNPEVRP